MGVRLKFLKTIFQSFKSGRYFAERVFQKSKILLLRQHSLRTKDMFQSRCSRYGLRCESHQHQSPKLPMGTRMLPAKDRLGCLIGPLDKWNPTSTPHTPPAALVVPTVNKQTQVTEASYSNKTTEISRNPPGSPSWPRISLQESPRRTSLLKKGFPLRSSWFPGYLPR